MSEHAETARLCAFVDGELALADQLDIEARLRDDAGLRTQVERLRALREAVREHASYHRAPSQLREHVRAVLAPPSAQQQRKRGPAWAQWRPWPAAFAAAAVSVLAIDLWLIAPRETQRIEEDVVASHVRATLGQRAVDVASSDHHTVKPWLSARLDYSPPVVEVGSGGATLLGGRVDYIAGRPVAALAYRRGAHVVDDFVWPAAGGDRPVAMSATRGFNIAHWTRAGMTHWLISDLNAGELTEFARVLASRD